MFIPMATLLLFLIYLLYFVFATPYPGIVFTTTATGWSINDSNQPEIRVGDTLVTIGDLTFAEYQANRLRVPFAGLNPGEEVPVTLSSGTEVVLNVLEPTLSERLKRVFSMLGFFPFWLAGTAVLLFLRPRDRRWILLLTFMYVIAIWFLAGSVSSWRIGGSRILLGITFWAMAPVFIHFHMTVPTALFGKATKAILFLIYGLFAVFTILELLAVTPSNTPIVGALLGVLGSVSLLLYRLGKQGKNSSERLATRLMLTGIALAFLPSIALHAVPQLLGNSSSGTFGFGVVQIAIPILPFFYIYAIYKRQLGPHEFRTNRLIGLYSFILLYPTLFLVLVLSGNRWLTTASDRTIYLLVISTLFAVTTPPLLTRFRQWINKLAYGTQHDPDTLIRVFAERVPSAFDRKTLVQLIVGDILPSLLIRQSCLILLAENQTQTLFAEHTPAQVTGYGPVQIQGIMQVAGRYRPPYSSETDQFAWIRLAIVLQTRKQLKGIWLFGKRDPDDFYPQADVLLLQTLANQIATTIENIQLYEALQQHASNLATEVAKRTAELRAEKDRQQAILDNAGEGIFFADSHGKILYANPAMTNQTGYATEELLAQPLLFWQDKAADIKTVAAMRGAIKRGQKWDGDLLLCRKDGHSYDASLTISPLSTANGSIDGFVGVQSDITNLKEVDRLKSDIIANVSHELRTPLTNIGMYLDLLRHGKPEKRGHYHDVLTRETARLTRLIQDLLDLSKLESGEVQTHVAPITLGDSVHAVLDSCEAKAQSKQIALVYEKATNLPRILADPIQLEQVLTNLITNAINYIPAGGTVTIHDAAGHLGDKEAVYITVADNGPGISPEDMPHIFDRFYRGRAGQNNDLPGTGLGLAICKEIIERHHGKIDVVNLPNAGAAFTVWLPAFSRVRELSFYT